MSSAALPRPSRRPAPAGAEPSSRLSALLRDRTGAAHVSAEAAFALDARLASRCAYAALLAGLRGFYAPVEAALASVAGWERLAPSLSVEARCRTALLDEDLRRLRAEPRSAGAEPPRAGRVMEAPRLDSLAQGLGCLYVLEGSALGGRIVAREARAALGDELPLAFFTSAGRGDLGGDWRSLRAALDRFGAAEGAPARAAAVATALWTFDALGAWLTAEVPVP
jgi:heme oxygenase